MDRDMVICLWKIQYLGIQTMYDLQEKIYLDRTDRLL